MACCAMQTASAPAFGTARHVRAWLTARCGVYARWDRPARCAGVCAHTLQQGVSSCEKPCTCLANGMQAAAFILKGGHPTRCMTASSPDPLAAVSALSYLQHGILLAVKGEAALAEEAARAVAAAPAAEPAAAPAAPAAPQPVAAPAAEAAAPAAQEAAEPAAAGGRKRKAPAGAAAAAGSKGAGSKRSKRG